MTYVAVIIDGDFDFDIGCYETLEKAKHECEQNLDGSDGWPDEAHMNQMAIYDVSGKDFPDDIYTYEQIEWLEENATIVLQATQVNLEERPDEPEIPDPPNYYKWLEPWQAEEWRDNWLHDWWGDNWGYDRDWDFVCGYQMLPPKENKSQESLKPGVHNV